MKTISNWLLWLAALLFAAHMACGQTSVITGTVHAPDGSAWQTTVEFLSKSTPVGIGTITIPTKRTILTATNGSFSTALYPGSYLTTIRGAPGQNGWPDSTFFIFVSTNLGTYDITAIMTNQLVALYPSGLLTTKGDIYVFGTNVTRLAVGTSNQVLTVDPSTATGLKYATAVGSGTVTSLNATSSTTALTISGGPITDAGTLNFGLHSNLTGWASIPTNTLSTVTTNFDSITVTNTVTASNVWDRSNVKYWGAKGDGVTDDTAAFTSAVAQTGTINIPLGTYLLTNSIILKSGTTLRGSGMGTVLKKNSVYAHALVNQSAPFHGTNFDSHIVVEDLMININSNSTLTGAAEVTANGEIQFAYASDITIRNVGITNGVLPMYAVHFQSCTNVLFTGMDINTAKDGIHIGNGCNNVVIENSWLNTGDDGIAIMPNDYPRIQNRADDIVNVTIRNVLLTNNIYGGGNIAFSIGSWTNWTSGFTYQVGELCVNGGNIYKVVNNVTNVASVAPTHTTFSDVTGADGISWRWLQTGTFRTSNIKGLIIQNVTGLQSTFALRAYPNVPEYNMCVYPGTENTASISGVVLNNVSVGGTTNFPSYFESGAGMTLAPGTSQGWNTMLDNSGNLGTSLNGPIVGPVKINHLVGTVLPPLWLQGGHITTDLNNITNYSSMRIDTANPAYSISLGYMDPGLGYLQSHNNTGPAALPLALNPLGGFVGIGTTNIQNALDIYGTSNSVLSARVNSYNSGTNAYAMFGMNAYGNAWGMRVGSAAANSNALEFVLDAFGTPSPKITVLTSGNVGFDTASPREKVEVFGNTLTSGTNFVPNISSLTNIALGSAMLKLTAGAYTAATFDPNGQLNIFYGTNFDRSGNVIHAIVPGSGIQGTTNADGSLTLATTNSGGTVTSIGVTSSVFTVTGSPITGAGNIGIEPGPSIVTTGQVYTATEFTNAVVSIGSANYQGTNAALTALAANANLYQATNEVLTGLISSKYPADSSSATNLVLDITKAMVFSITNNTTVAHVTNLSASATTANFGTFTVFNRTANPYTLILPAAWQKCSPTNSFTVTNGTFCKIALDVTEGADPTNVTFGLAWKNP